MLEYIEECYFCNGEGRIEQMYNAGCGMGMYRSIGPCDYCNEMGYVYKATGKPVTSSVINQMENEE